MKPVALSKWAVVLLVCICASSPLYATCYRESCVVGPPITCQQLLFDTGFDEPSCHSYWELSGSVEIVDTGFDEHGRLYGSGSIAQQVLVPTGYGTYKVNVLLDVVPGTLSGTEKVYVEIIGSGISQRVATFSSFTADGSYNFSIGNYGGSLVSLRFRYVPGFSPGNTEFRILHTNYWAY